VDYISESKALDREILGAIHAWHYRGVELEHTSSFQQRISVVWPKAEVLSYTNVPPEDVRSSDRQFLQIFTVKTSSQDDHKEILNDRMPPNIKKFILHNDVETFTYSKPFRKDKDKKPENEFEGMWIKNTHFQTNDMFPTIRRRSEVVRMWESETNPLENAINILQTKNEELDALIAKYSAQNASQIQLSPFTGALNGVIDAAVSGGVAVFQRTFLTKEYEKENPNSGEMLEKLKQKISEHVEIMGEGLVVHARLCSDDMLGLQQQLEIKLKELQQTTNKDQPPPSPPARPAKKAPPTPGGPKPPLKAPLKKEGKVKGSFYKKMIKKDGSM